MSCKLLGPIFGVLGAILGFAAPHAWTLATDPPATSTVTTVMDQEIRAAMTRDLGLAGRLYAPDATVTDAACQTQGASATWKGDEIGNRYRNLPEFDALHHVGARVSWQPSNRLATRAEVSADTIGVIAASDTQPRSQAIVGHESWSFVKSDDRWVIESFTYNLCLL